MILRMHVCSLLKFSNDWKYRAPAKKAAELEKVCFSEEAKAIDFEQN